MEAFDKEGRISDHVPKEILKMYNVPGQDTVTQHSFERYLGDKGRDEQKIVDLAKIPSNSPITNFLYLSEAEKFESLKKMLTSEDSSQRKLAGEFIGQTSRLSELQDVALKFVEKNLSFKDPSHDIIAAEMISCIPINKRTGILLYLLETGDEKTQLTASTQLWSVPLDAESEVNALISKITDLINIALSANSPDSDLFAAQLLVNAPEGTITKAINRILDTTNYAAQVAALEAMLYVKHSERFQLIKKALNSHSYKVRNAAASFIFSLSGHEQTELQSMLTKSINQAVSSNDTESQLNAAEMIRFAPIRQQVFLIEDILNKTNNTEVSKMSLRAMRNLNKEERREVLELAIDKLGNALVEAPLYDSGDISEDAFKRKKFEKTGSGTTLLGGRLKGKSIVRHIEPQAFLAWQKIYEDEALWRQKGFDYVPIEPIQSFRLNKNGLVDVYSGVLDLNLETWLEMTDMFAMELVDAKLKILSLLERNRFNHGHVHDRNFSLRFFRDENGRVDFTKKPRLYLIDFDAATYNN
ncbi:MAG: hypothetical protein HY226_06875 [Candidatus Vogelbacteria bacterium]|nr:hypothetical protein [Candidatus Vogelbacteria bacterium]